jgi:hypothetical protein
MDARPSSLRDQALLAALQLCDGDLEQSFTAEELLVRAWKNDNAAWGLRGFEKEHPDPEKMKLEVERRSTSLVRAGMLMRERALIYRLTPAGLSAASKLQPSNVALRERADRKLEESIRPILEHPVFRAWLKDSGRPKHFREAGHFWGIAPGTPAKSVRERIDRIEKTLTAALQLLNEKNAHEIMENRGRVLFDRTDIERCEEFHETLKTRFSRDLALLDPSFAESTNAEQSST